MKAWVLGLVGWFVLGFATAHAQNAARHPAQYAAQYAGGPKGYIRTFSQEAVAADHPLASQAGAEVLAMGGSAADAAIATMLTLGVVNPISSGLGGGGFGLYYEAKTGKTRFFDFRERAPARATPDMFKGQVGVDGPYSNPSQYGGLSTAVPGEMAGMATLHDAFGRLESHVLVQPALRHAQNGVRVGRHFADTLEPFVDQMAKDPVLARWIDPQTNMIRAGVLVKQPELAATLEQLAAGWSGAYYNGPIGKEIVRSNQAHGGLLTTEDLAAYKVIERTPLEGDRLGYRWVTAPLPSAGGLAMLESLALLERWVSKERRGEWDGFLFHAFAESWKGAYWDRAQWYGDPDFVDVPLDVLTNRGRFAIRASIFRPALAMHARTYDSPIHFPLRATPPTSQAAARVQDYGTSHLCVVDREGNVASITTTVNFILGARYTAAGMVMNDQMDDFGSEAGAANAFGLPGGAANLPEPGKTPISSMVPTIVFQDGAPVLCIGASGGSRIPTHSQLVAWRLLVSGQDPKTAIDAPRIHHQGAPDHIRAEEDRVLPRSVEEQLVARGHEMHYASYSAVVQFIHLDNNAGVLRLVAASDPRKGGIPAGR